MNLHDLPGTDSRFHEPRKYLSPMKYRGQMILASHGSCKQDSCHYSSAWTSNAARDRGMWLHRALKVREARMLYFIERFGDKDQAKLGQLFLETADNNSHFYKPWLEVVNQLMVEAVEVGVEDLPDYDTFLDYKVGTSAIDAVNKILAHATTL
jgi:hypothetical protein